MADAASAVRVVITGGAGFLGSLLARRLLASPLTLQGGQAAQVGELFLVDLVAPPADLAADSRVRPVVGELGTVLGELGEADAVFHSERRPALLRVRAEDSFDEIVRAYLADNLGAGS